MKNNLPKGWIECSLGDVCTKPQYGWTSKASKSGKIKYLRTTDISNSNLNWETVPYCLDEPSDILKYQVYKNDILVSRAGSVGFNFRVTEDVNFKAVFASYLIRFRTFDEITSRYVGYFLKSESYWKQISDFTAGIAIPNVNASKLEGLRIPIPPLAEQQRIVAKLDELMEKIDSSRARLERIPIILKRFRQSVLSAAVSGKLTEEWREKSNPTTAGVIIEQIKVNRFNRAKSETQKQKLYEIYSRIDDGGRFEVPETWALVSLNKLCESLEYGSSSKSESKGRIPVLRMGNIQDGKIDWSDLKYSSNKKEIEKYSLCRNDVLFNRTNSPELVGKTAIYKGEQPALYAGYLIRIKTLKELDPDFLNLCMNSTQAREWCLEVKTDGVSQSNINASKLGEFEIPFCSLEEQGEIVKKVSQLFNILSKMEERFLRTKNQFDSLSQSLLAKAFRGELVPQDRNDEPASELMSRINSSLNRKERKVRSAAPLEV